MKILKKLVLVLVISLMVFPSMLFAANSTKVKNIVDTQVINQISKEQYYFKGDKLDLTGLELKILYDDLTLETINVEDSRIKIEGFDPEKIGLQKVKVKLLDHGIYRDIYDFSAVVLESKKGVSLSSGEVENEENVLKIGAPSRKKRKTVLDMMVVSMPTREQAYQSGDEIDFSGLVIGVQYSNDTYEEIHYDDYRLNYIYDSNYIGTQSLYVTFTYGSAMGTTSKYTGYLFDIVIQGEDQEKVVTSLEIESFPTKVDYKVGEDLDLAGGYIKLYYSDDTSETFDMSNPIFNIFNYDSNAVGSQTVIIQLAEDSLDGIDYYKKLVGFNVYVSDIDSGGQEENAEISASSKNYRINSYDLDNAIINELYDLKGNIPSKYNMNDNFLLKVANQSSLGLCALFSTNKGLETNFAYSNGKLHDLSERHMDYMTSQLLYGIRDIGNLATYEEGDGVGFTSEIPLMEMYGSALESDIPYIDYSTDELEDIVNAKLVSKLKSCIYFSKVSPSDSNYDKFKNIIKTHIMNYGSVYVCIVSPSLSTYINRDTSAYYKSEDVSNYSSLHAVSIIGWDDSYSRDNFKTKPEHDGAWIVLNSWGESWGDNGYFYISYDSDFINMLGILDTDKTHETKEYTYAKSLLNQDYTFSDSEESTYYYIEFDRERDTEYLENIIIPNQIYSSEKSIKVYLVNNYTGANIDDYKYVGELNSANAFGSSNLILDTPIKLEGNRFLIIVECPIDCFLPVYETGSVHTYYTTRNISNDYSQATYELPVFVYTISEDTYQECKKKMSITNIEVDTLPDKLTIATGEDLDLTGGKIKVNYKDGSSEIVDMKNEEVGYYGVTPTSANGTNSVTVVYKENKTAFNVTIGDVEIPSGDSSGDSTSGDTNTTSGDTGTTSGDTGTTSGDTGSTSGDTGSTSGDTGTTSGDTGTTSGDNGSSSGGSSSGGSSSGGSSSGGSSSGGSSSGGSSSGGSSSGGSSSGGSTTETVVTYKITVVNSTGGTISPSTTKVEKGDNQKFTITANKGYVIKDVLVDGKSVGAVETYTFKNVKDAHKITATFEKETVKENNQPNVSGDKSGDKLVNTSGDTSGDKTISGDTVVPASSNDSQKVFEAFEDIKSGDWYYDAVKFAVGNKLFNGMSEKEFAPNVSMTRGMLVTVLYRLDGANELSESTFSDVKKSSYYTHAIAWAAKNGIVNGVGNNKFAPDQSISREDLATIISRYIAKKEFKLENEAETIVNYADANKIASYAKESIDTLSQKGLMQGKNANNFDPKGKTTRAEVATLLMRLINKRK